MVDIPSTDEEEDRKKKERKKRRAERKEKEAEKEAARAEREAAELQASKKQNALQGFFGFAGRKDDDEQGSDKKGSPGSRSNSLD